MRGARAALLLPPLATLLLAPSPAAPEEEPSGGEAREAARRIVDWLDRGLRPLVSPGPLAAAHAELEGIERCRSCHSALGGTPPQRCFECHEEVEERLREARGVHGAFRAPCGSCHPEHRGAEADLLGLDREAFAHDQALFALRGVHVGLDCEACHLRDDPETGRKVFRTLGLAFARCTDCHRDPHPAGFAGDRDCASCHDESSFSRLRAAAPAEAAGEAAAFDHDRDTRFPLRGMHRSVDCAACHTPERREAARRSGSPPGRSVPRDCGGCHEDPHRGRLGDRCGDCHREQGFRLPEVAFDHDRDTDFPLDALHGRLACSECHADAGFEAAGTRCADCHELAAGLLEGRVGATRGEPDPHAGRLECRDCHAEAMAEPTLSDYAAACTRCHPESYGELLLSRRRILDGLLVRAEARRRSRELARRRGESAEAAGPGEAEALVRLAESGAHNPDLAERILRAALDRSPPGNPGGDPR